MMTIELTMKRDWSLAVPGGLPVLARNPFPDSSARALSGSAVRSLMARKKTRQEAKSLLKTCSNLLPSVDPPAAVVAVVSSVNTSRALSRISSSMIARVRACMTRVVRDGWRSGYSMLRPATSAAQQGLETESFCFF